MLQRLFSTTSDPAALAARLMVALVLFPHGAQKVLGWFGGYGFRATLQYFAGIGIPSLLGVAAIAVEFLAPIALFFGLGGRLAALGVAIVMAVAALRVHLQHGFFMNWFGNQKGEGIEFHLVVIALALVVMVRGSGAWSLDGLVRTAMR